MSKKWRGYKSYGTSALGVDFSFSGLDEYLEKINKIGNSIDDAVSEAVKEAAPIPLESMKRGAEGHKRSGEVLNAIKDGRVERERNYTYVQIGIDIKKHPEAKHAVFQEYGDGHSPGFPDPFIRPAFDDNKAKIKSTMRQVLKSKGVPID